MLQKIVAQVSEKTLRTDLERYRQTAIDLGATDAKIICAGDVIVEDRVVAKCLFPRCPVSGTNIHCPPYAPDTEKVRKIVQEFDHGILFKVDSSYDTSSESNQQMKLKNLEILGKIEAQAYYEGYYLAVGFGGASCKTTLCPDQECTVLYPGRSCRHPLRGRPSMHAVGMDAYKMAVRAGWDIYPIGKASNPSEVPFVSHLGLILIY